MKKATFCNVLLHSFRFASDISRVAECFESLNLDFEKMLIALEVANVL